MCRACELVMRKYRRHYGSELQGLCLLFADEISRMTGGVPTAGYLTAYGGNWRRQHWWVTGQDGSIHDPIGDEYRDEPGFRREEAHRSQVTFRVNLTKYEGYRR